jgi:hypothetical protein
MLETIVSWLVDGASILGGQDRGAGQNRLPFVAALVIAFGVIGVGLVPVAAGSAFGGFILAFAGIIAVAILVLASAPGRRS